MFHQGWLYIVGLPNEKLKVKHFCWARTATQSFCEQIYGLSSHGLQIKGLMVKIDFCSSVLMDFISCIASYIHMQKQPDQLNFEV